MNNPALRILRSTAVVALALCAVAAQATTFDEELQRVDDALKTNPSGVLKQSLESCLQQRNFAVSLYRARMTDQARRSLGYCFDSLQIPRKGPRVTVITAEELQARARKEYDEALALTPDTANGLQIYRECAACHQPEGWGYTTGSVPQIAGQHPKVIIKQLADLRAGSRQSGLMAPYAAVEVIGGTQALADVAAYISTLEISVANGQGPGSDLERGASLYAEHCAECHGVDGEGNNDDLVPRLQAQHYRYLVRQFQWIRDGGHRDANADMKDTIHNLDDGEMAAVLDYASRLLPPEELRAPDDWNNPDFVQ